MTTQDMYKELLLRGVAYGTYTSETLVRKKQEIEEHYADDPDGLEASRTHAATCEVLNQLQQRQSK